MTGRRLFILGNSFSKPIPLNPFPFLYIPQFSRFTLLVYLTLSQSPKRDLQILSEFNGRNHHALARKYGLTPSSIYKLLKRIQDRKFERDQGKLDLGDGLA
ncbi:Mor transcription activator family protein [Pseudomonas aeruginosa]|uniref:Mor transcription activator family protein n=1 Tax=Pseudomonas aeruginosa TaxID=287 RepID=UPI001EDCCFB9|nr:Mor transcription activator family protein [Pseudomonas aeruginosa]